MNDLLILIILVLGIWAFFIEPNSLTVKKYDVDCTKGMRIVYASDFHIGKCSKERLQKIVKLINMQNPDLVLLGGDYIKGYTGDSSLDIKIQAKELAKINAPKISVLGNHDCRYDREAVKEALEEVGITVLVNSNSCYNGLWIAGVDDKQVGFPDVKEALKGTSTPRILLTHTPDIYYDVKDDVDLILAGHTHGGQVAFPFIGAPCVPSEYGSKFAERVIEETQNKMIITKGLGTSILPVRFNSVPEIVVLESSKTKQN